MKRPISSAVSLVAAASVIAFVSCGNSRSPVTPAENQPGSANITVKVGNVGALGKTAIELQHLYITLFAPSEATIYDTFSLSGNAQQTISKTYSNLASLVKTWTLSAEVRDVKDSLIHSGDTSFIVPARSVISVSLNLGAKYSMLNANYFPIRDSVTRCKLLIDGGTVADSLFAKQALLGDTVKLSFDYLKTDVAQRVKMEVYGDMWGFDTLLYTGDTLITPLPGQNASYSVVLRWVGPASPPPGGAAMSVVIGAVGTVTVNGVLSPVDIDGNVYTTVTIGTQTWMVENLKTTRYNDGTAIPLVTDNAAWGALTTPGYCWDSNYTVNKDPYGALYNWYAVNTGKLAPTGWHVATDAEWDTLIEYLGGVSVAGGKLKDTGTTYWDSPNIGATNETGFTAVAGGCRFTDGQFMRTGYSDGWWTSTPDAGSNSWYHNMAHDITNAYRGSGSWLYGFSVRCVRDN